MSTVGARAIHLRADPRSFPRKSGKAIKKMLWEPYGYWLAGQFFKLRHLSKAHASLYGGSSAV